MRTIFWSLSIIASCLIGCNSNKDTGKEQTDSTTKVDTNSKKTNLLDTTSDCSGVGNLIVDPTVADTWIKLFAKHHIREGTGNPVPNLEKTVWIDSCVITGFAKYFKDNSNYDGARFYGGAFSSNNKSTLILIPTIEIMDSGNKKHEDVVSARIPVDPRNCNREFKNFNLTQGQFDAMKEKFGRDFRRDGTSELVDSLSISVWISNCVFEALSDLIRANRTLLDGVRVYFATYDKLDPRSRRGQIYKHQSTIIIVPTMPDGRRGHRDNWEILKASPLYQKYIGFDGAFNHGELCPDDCPMGGN